VNPLLSFQKISSGYGKKQVLDNVSFEVEKGECIVLIGSNGAGKSTILRTIYGLNTIWSHDGDIVFKDSSLQGLITKDLLELGIVFISQKKNTFDGMTVLENLQVAGYRYQRVTLGNRIEQVISSLPGLSKDLLKQSGDLSGGERQILALAMGLIHEPSLILIDEPFAGLDTKRINVMSVIINELNNKGISFIIVEHRIHEAFVISDRFLGLKLGQLVFHGNKAKGFKPDHGFGDLFL